MTRARQTIAVMTTFRKFNRNSLEHQAGTHQVGKETSIQGTPALMTTNQTHNYTIIMSGVSYFSPNS